MTRRNVSRLPPTFPPHLRGSSGKNRASIVRMPAAAPIETIPLPAPEAQGLTETNPHPAAHAPQTPTAAMMATTTVTSAGHRRPRALRKALSPSPVRGGGLERARRMSAAKATIASRSTPSPHTRAMTEPLPMMRKMLRAQLTGVAPASASIAAAASRSAFALASSVAAPTRSRRGWPVRFSVALFESLAALVWRATIVADSSSHCCAVPVPQLFPAVHAWTFSRHRTCSASAPHRASVALENAIPAMPAKISVPNRATRSGLTAVQSEAVTQRASSPSSFRLLRAQATRSTSRLSEGQPHEGHAPEPRRLQAETPRVEQGVRQGDRQRAVIPDVEPDAHRQDHEEHPDGPPAAVEHPAP